MARPVRTLSISPEQRRELRAMVNRPSAPYRDIRRAWIILNRADGLSQTETARKVGVRQSVVVQWEQRFRSSGIAGLSEVKRPGRKPRIAPQIREKIIVGATRPPKNRARWSVRTMAKAMEVSKATVQRLWSANAVKPHVTRTFKISKDKNFEKKFWDVIGLYLNPPDRALVLCCDEKSQCQALERTQSSLPVMRGYRRTQTHDYIRHGTVTLFAALSYLDGKILSRTAEQHTHKEWLAFLKVIERETPAGLQIHLIIDNYAMHKHPAVKSWLARHPRFHLHFTPTSSSW